MTLQEVALIMEDDAVPVANFNAALAAVVSELPADWDVAQLRSCTTELPAHWAWVGSRTRVFRKGIAVRALDLALHSRT